MFLAALAVIAVPIIVHLFYFRRFKRVYFSEQIFLKEVKKNEQPAKTAQPAGVAHALPGDCHDGVSLCTAVYSAFVR
ncbi:MAG: BatA domain-containing protein [Lewinellaceae bacterium]|nr:BatA domain-containing protein [Lewinellaceae bacterium]